MHVIPIDTDQLAYVAVTARSSIGFMHEHEVAPIQLIFFRHLYNLNELVRDLPRTANRGVRSFRKEYKTTISLVTRPGGAEDLAFEIVITTPHPVDLPRLRRLAKGTAEFIIHDLTSP